MNNSKTIKIFLGGGTNRNSGVELLKVIAVFVIVISHVVQWLSTDYGFGTFSDYVIELGCSTNDATTLILTFMRYFGGLGNDIFFICTAWFMVDKKPRSHKRIFSMIADVWIISMIMLIVIFVVKKSVLNGNIYGILISVFPVSLGCYWYITCYILFCLLHPYLNIIIKNQGQRELLRIVIVMSSLYIVINFFAHNLFFASRIIIWVAIYFFIAYCKKYTTIIDDTKFNVLILLIGIIGNIAVVLITNFLGLRFEIFRDKLLYWHQNSSPFLIMTSFGAFNIFRKLNFKNRFINYISSLSLYIYIIHSNIWFATYLGSVLWHEIFIRYGHQYVIAWVFIYSVVLFLIVTAFSAIYQRTLHQIVLRMLDKVFQAAKIVYKGFESCILKIR